jgi:NLI interacting factor-like phosphatase
LLAFPFGFWIVSITCDNRSFFFGGEILTSRENTPHLLLRLSFPFFFMKAVGGTFSGVPVTTSASSSHKMPKPSSNRFFVFHYILVLYRWICSMFQSNSGPMKLTHVIDEQQDTSPPKHDEAKTTGTKPDAQDYDTSLRHRMGSSKPALSLNDIPLASSRSIATIPRTISLSSIPQNLNTSSTQIHKSASKLRGLSRLADDTLSPSPPQSSPPPPPSPSTTRQQATSSPKGERALTPSIPHPLPLSYYRSKTLVLDLDETLIHSTSRGNGVPGASGRAHVIEVVVDKHACLYYVYKRPHVDYFLRKVSGGGSHCGLCFSRPALTYICL